MNLLGNNPYLCSHLHLDLFHSLAEWRQLLVLPVFYTGLFIFHIVVDTPVFLWHVLFQITLGSRFFYWKRCKFKSKVTYFEAIHKWTGFAVGKWLTSFFEPRKRTVLKCIWRGTFNDHSLNCSSIPSALPTERPFSATETQIFSHDSRSHPVLCFKDVTGAERLSYMKKITQPIPEAAENSTPA